MFPQTPDCCQSWPWSTQLSIMGRSN
jgi:hypothetical protein